MLQEERPKHDPELYEEVIGDGRSEIEMPSRYHGRILTYIDFQKNNTRKIDGGNAGLFLCKIQSRPLKQNPAEMSFSNLGNEFQRSGNEFRRFGNEFHPSGNEFWHFGNEIC